MEILLIILFAIAIFLSVIYGFFYFIWKAFKILYATFPLISLAIFTILFLLFIKKNKKTKIQNFFNH
ncbi:hypothetical protein AVBRAN_1632 [Campylobacter sp. RM12651]|nr:hypothetical protein AVBRAN_1632 [Campylobacter sp. RM12651]